MCVCSTAKRRRRQAKNRYNHIAKRQRPLYSRSAPSTGPAMQKKKK